MVVDGVVDVAVVVVVTVVVAVVAVTVLRLCKLVAGHIYVNSPKARTPS